MTASILEVPAAPTSSRRPIARIPRAGTASAAPVCVVATTVESTRTALVTAAALADGSGAPPLMLVPWVVPYAEPLDHPADSVALGGNKFRRLAEELGISVTVRVCLCRSADEAMSAMLPPRATVVVSGPSRQWWPTREQRLAARLSRSGRRVVFVAEGGKTPADNRKAAPAVVIGSIDESRG